MCEICRKAAGLVNPDGDTIDTSFVLDHLKGVLYPFGDVVDPPLANVRVCTGHRETPNARPPCCHAIIVPPCHCAATPQATIWVDVESLKEWEEIKRRRPKGKEVMLEEWRNR